MSRELAHVRQELDCQVCLSLLFDPVTLPCGHSFCRVCVLRASDHVHGCPLCRAPFYYDALGCASSTVLRSTIVSLFPAEYAARRQELEEEGAILPLDEVDRPGDGPIVFSLPLFPLNCVVFPGEKFQLFIFEPRYVLMLKHVMRSSRCLGLVNSTCVRDTNAVGVLLRIENVAPVGPHRFLVNTVGALRFRVRSFHECESYLVGMLETLRDTPEQCETEPTLSQGRGNPGAEATAREESERLHLGEQHESGTATVSCPVQTPEQASPCAELSSAAVARQLLDYLRTNQRNSYVTAAERAVDSQAYDEASFLMSHLLVRDVPSRQLLLEMTSTRSRLQALAQMVWGKPQRASGTASMQGRSSSMRGRLHQMRSTCTTQ
ncbi:LON peptidase N-terminal domain and RING finger protein 1 [Porphyridium purpureum]|uniref:LON peptidase N-terminal domain and RING finger protein 1 n=1 Tax=Porphyridium purpureum TaxID=35688 RepID=A0A5J4Z3Q8_PORPP|nr:LON peptidase N-terminal domain and RING finger protein 1 [Porphyridium purpureum]|eukprot:POR1206..scf295_1